MSRSNPPKPPTESNDGRNQYIPSFIAAKPFFASSLDDDDYLAHQRNNAAPKDTLDKAKWYDRGKRTGPAATKYRKGACENCGSASHKTKDCLYRPRKTGAKYTGKDIQADEVVDSVSLGWDAKRDRWNGYDAREYTQVIKEYEELEAMKKKASGTPDVETTDGAPAPVEDARYGEETDMGRSQPTSTRQLRLREDTAKYLLDLDLESAKYDPKTRSMDTTTPSDANQIDVSSGFTRPSESAALERAQKYAWETQESSSSAPKIHLEANPTEGLLLLKHKEATDAEAKAARVKYLAEKYGTTLAPPTPTGNQPSKPSILSSERYVEYDSSGAVKGLPKTVARSKYPEDLFQNNHTSVWGSWWRDFQWGYACCHSTVKNSYCTGEEGKVAFEEAAGLRKGQGLLTAGEEDQKRLELEQNGEGIAELKTDIKAETSKAEAKERGMKRTIQEIQSGITEEDMESYKRNKLSAGDPMARMLGRDELLEQT